MTAHSSGHWDAQERVGEVRLSERDTLIVSLVRHEAEGYVRLRVHRRETVEGKVRSQPTERGLIIPVERVSDLVALLTQAVEQKGHRRL